MFITLGIVNAAGCVAGTTREDLRFSAEGTCVCYLKEDRLEEPWLHGKVWSRSISLHWCRTSDPAKESSVAIDTLGVEFGGYIHVPCLGAEWSPDASRIGVLTPHKLVIVETGSRKKTEIRDGQIMGFTWLSAEKIAYCTRRARSGMQRRVICRQNVLNQRGTEVVALPEHSGKYLKDDYSLPTHWSPSGKYAIFLEPRSPGQFHCVDLLDGTMRTFGQTDASDQGVVWAPGSARAFCVSRKVGPEDLYEAVLFEPATGRTLDCTAGFQAAFGDGWSAASATPSVWAPVWTRDGKYIIASGSSTGGLLVQPDPWRVIPLGQAVAAGLRIKSRPWLFSLPVAG
jgi:hypothetical protein